MSDVSEDMAVRLLKYVKAQVQQTTWGNMQESDGAEQTHPGLPVRRDPSCLLMAIEKTEIFQPPSVYLQLNYLFLMSNKIIEVKYSSKKNFCQSIHSWRKCY